MSIGVVSRVHYIVLHEMSSLQIFPLPLRERELKGEGVKKEEARRIRARETKRAAEKPPFGLIKEHLIIL
jgi:hypothetical protein